MPRKIKNKQNSEDINREIDEIALFAKEKDEDCLEILMDILMPLILKKSMKYRIESGPVCDFDDLVSTCVYIATVGIGKYDISRGGILTFLKRYLDWKLKAHVFGKESLPGLPKEYPFFYRERIDKINVDLYEEDYLVSENNYAVHELEEALLSYAGKSEEEFEKAKRAMNEII